MNHFACPLNESRKEREQEGYNIGYADEAAPKS